MARCRLAIGSGQPFRVHDWHLARSDDGCATFVCDCGAQKQVEVHPMQDGGGG